MATTVGQDFDYALYSNEGKSEKNGDFLWINPHPHLKIYTQVAVDTEATLGSVLKFTGPKHDEKNRQTQC